MKGLTQLRCGTDRIRRRGISREVDLGSRTSGAAFLGVVAQALKGPHWKGGVLNLAACLTVLAAATAIPSQKSPLTPTADQATFFESKIRPIFVNRCVSCHGPNLQLGGLRLDTQEGAAKGGNSGAAIVPGEPDKSLLVKAIRQTG